VGSCEPVFDAPNDEQQLCAQHQPLREQLDRPNQRELQLRKHASAEHGHESNHARHGNQPDAEHGAYALGKHQLTADDDDEQPQLHQLRPDAAIPAARLLGGRPARYALPAAAVLAHDEYGRRAGQLGRELVAELQHAVLELANARPVPA